MGQPAGAGRPIELMAGPSYARALLAPFHILQVQYSTVLVHIRGRRDNFGILYIRRSFLLPHASIGVIGFEGSLSPGLHFLVS